MVMVDGHVAKAISYNLTDRVPSDQRACGMLWNCGHEEGGLNLAR